MQHEHRALDALFAPEPGMYGTHMLACGLSADIDTLEAMMTAFTGETNVRRAASGQLRGLLMLDASSEALGALAVPGMIGLAPCTTRLWEQRTSLMHAKVALLGFSDQPLSAPKAFRLVVSTGNWTRATWANRAQIDMFWSTQCTLPLLPAARPDEQRDIAEAFQFLDRVIGMLYADNARALVNQPFTLDWLKQWTQLLQPANSSKNPRFLHSLDKPLFGQIKKRFPKNGVASLVAGSGFFEQGADGAVNKPEVLTQLETLATPGRRYLVVNADQAGAVANWVKANPKSFAKSTLDGWTLCAPTDPLQAGTLGRTNLHAKYIAGIRQVRLTKGWIAALYLGSGNLSRAGLLSAATGPSTVAGNIEAGVFLNDEHEIDPVWRALACGDELAPDTMKALQPGDGEQILVPLEPPPVLLARLSEGWLQLIRSEVPPSPLQIRMDSTAGWSDIDAETGAACEGMPAVVWVRESPGDANAEPRVYEVAVVTAAGAIARQPPTEQCIDDILASLRTFPAAPPEPLPPGKGGDTGKRPASESAKRYPLHLLAMLIEAIGHRNSMVTEEQFPYWLSQVRTLLLEQASDADRTAVRNAGINLFPALLEPGFVPEWLESSASLHAAYQTLLTDLIDAWTLPGATQSTAEFMEQSNEGASLEEQN